MGVGVARLRLDFVAPSEFGFDERPEGSALLAVSVGLPNGRLKTTDMIHYVRSVEGGAFNGAVNILSLDKRCS
jgi:hypothetical protein